ncbi:MAG TPA: DUF4956 domain-containing protein [Bacteroidetes bacterium]|nr:DUF4956 domain-containing protein [Bacteroidota bacterium]
MQFEDFLSEFSTDVISHQQFVLNALLAALLSYFLGAFYSKYGSSITNRKRFGNNFMFLALTTMLIIYIVKSSIALSLGLVGALSIVRFRAAIKEPEELVYLFFSIGIGLGMGANQAVVTVLAYILIMSLLMIQALVLRKKQLYVSENMFINISTKELSAEKVNEVLTKHFSFVELKRMDHFNNKLDLSYIVETEAIENIIKAKDEMVALSPAINFSFMEQRNLAA